MIPCSKDKYKDETHTTGYLYQLEFLAAGVRQYI